MTEIRFEWDQFNEPKVKAHKISVAEAEWVANTGLEIGLRYENGEERVTMVGATLSGRVLVVSVVFSSPRQARIITAYPAPKGLANFYYRETQR